MTTKTCGLPILSALCEWKSDDSASSFDEAIPWHDLKPDGLWVKPPDPLLGPGEREAMAWHPHGDRTRPALPLPFDARDVAAFMLAVGGLSLYERFDGDDDDDTMAEKAISWT